MALGVVYARPLVQVQPGQVALPFVLCRQPWHTWWKTRSSTRLARRLPDLCETYFALYARPLRARSRRRRGRRRRRLLRAYLVQRRLLLHPLHPRSERMAPVPDLLPPRRRRGAIRKPLLRLAQPDLAILTSRSCSGSSVAYGSVLSASRPYLERFRTHSSRSLLPARRPIWVPPRGGCKRWRRLPSHLRSASSGLRRPLSPRRKRSRRRKLRLPSTRRCYSGSRSFCTGEEQLLPKPPALVSWLHKPVLGCKPTTGLSCRQHKWSHLCLPRCVRDLLPTRRC